MRRHSDRTPPFVDPIARSVEALSIFLHRRTRRILLPHDVKKALIADIREKKGAAPDMHECEALIEIVLQGMEPEWVINRWPRLLGLLQLAVKDIS